MDITPPGSPVPALLPMPPSPAPPPALLWPAPMEIALDPEGGEEQPGPPWAFAFPASPPPPLFANPQQLAQQLLDQPELQLQQPGLPNGPAVNGLIDHINEQLLNANVLNPQFGVLLQGVQQALNLIGQLDPQAAEGADDLAGLPPLLDADNADAAADQDPLMAAVHLMQGLGGMTLQAPRPVRKRGPSDTEPAVFDVMDPATKKATRTAEQQVFLRSIVSEAPTTVIFHNTSASTAVAYWLDYTGQEIAYGTIAPGEKKRYRTFATHPWLMRDLDTDARLMLGNRMVMHAPAKEETIVIADVPTLPWTTASHSQFPGEFKATCKALLLSHAHLAMPPPPAPLSPTQLVPIGPLSKAKALGGTIASKCLSVFGAGRSHQQQQQVSAQQAKQAIMDEPEQPNELAQLLTLLPAHLMPEVCQAMAPVLPQSLSMPARFRPGVEPALLPSDPSTWPPMPGQLPDVQQDANAAGGQVAMAQADGQQQPGDGDHAMPGW